MAKRTKTAAAGAGTLSIEELQAELRRRQKRLPSLYRKLAKAQARVRTIASAIEALGGSAGAVAAPGRRPLLAGGRKRHKNDTNLIEALAKLLKGRTMSVTEATAKVQDAGYKTTAANCRTIVNQTLIKSNKFRKVSRGQYTAA